MYNAIRQKSQQQNSNSSQSSKNSKESVGQGEYKHFFRTNFATQYTSRGLLEVFLLFILIGGILMLSLILSVQSSRDTSEMRQQMKLQQIQISELSEGIMNSKEEQMRKDIALLSEQTKTDFKEIMKNQSDWIAALKDQILQIKDFNIQQVQSLKESLSQIAFQQVQSQKEIENLPVLQQRQIELISNVQEIVKQSEQTKNDQKEMDRYLLDQISGLKDSLTQAKDLNISSVQTLKDSLSQIAFEQVQNQQDIKNLPLLQERQIQLISNVQEIMKQSEQTKNDQKEMDKYQQTLKETISQIAFQQVQIQKDIENLSVLQQKYIELIINVSNISKDLDEIKKQFPELSVNLNALSSETKRLQQDMITTQQLSPKLEGISVKVEHLYGDLDKVQTQHQTMISSSSANPLINNIDTQISAIKADIEALKSQIPFAGVLPTIEHYGPFIGNTWMPSFIAIDTVMTIYPTTKPCFITVTGKAVITLIATGMAVCNFHGQMTFMKDRQINLEKTGDLQKYYGVQFVFRDWTPVNLTQEFYVDEGTYEFTLGMNSMSGQYTFTTQSLSFVAKVQYIQ